MPVNMRITGVFLLVFTCTAVAPAWAQDDFGIADNSFLLEEAFNQDAGIFQNIATYRWQRGEWLGSFTQEWPFPSMTHQLSFTLPFGRVANSTAVGDVLVNYRLQVLREGNRRPAFSPRVSVIIPSSPADSGLGNNVFGWQFNLPFSKRVQSWYFHWNSGVTLAPPDQEMFGESADALVSPFMAGSAIWRASSRLNFLVELVAESIASARVDGVAEGVRAFTVSPGFRYAWNPKDQQVVVGIAAPITRSDRRNRGSVFTYFSYELPFK